MKNWIHSEKKIVATKHKYYNLQIGVYTQKDQQTNIFSFETGWSRRCDHAGFKFEINIWNFFFIFYTYDNRHWCYWCNAWESDKCECWKKDKNENR